MKRFIKLQQIVDSNGPARDIWVNPELIETMYEKSMIRIGRPAQCLMIEFGRQRITVLIDRSAKNLMD